MKLFKTVDDRFEEIGFKKIEESYIFIRYQRYNEKYKYTQTLDLCHKATGKHIAYSCDNDLSDQKNIGNTCVGLTMYEMKLCIKKMRKMGWKMIKE